MGVLTETYWKEPGCCALCRGTALPAWDTGIEPWDPELGWKGRMYICSVCFTEWGQSIGMLTVEQTDALRAEAEEAIAAAVDLADEVTLLKGARVAIANANAKLNPPPKQPPLTKAREVAEVASP